ncbi:complement C1q-like protein 4 [Sebastes umbrosus]|uniref:complement C1q-like protein 4 n=1 Tax=Sebastes umbrosus TaxID=72105 RepID=UPI00189D3BC2|nr:complement C1q-like protein 4 [Sebastes umbrosus]
MRAIVLMCLLHAALARYDGNHFGHSTSSPPPKEGRECITDQGACGCCVMVQEVNRLTTYFETSLNTLEMETMQTAQRLNNIEASRVAFSSSMNNADRMTCFGPFPDNRLVPYDYVFINLGDGYNASTNIFTAPHSGVYSIALTIYSDAGSPGNTLAACASLQVNGKVLVGSSERNKQDQEDSATIVVALQLNTGEEVAVRLSAGCFLCDDKNHYNTFSAFLLYPTP